MRGALHVSDCKDWDAFRRGREIDIRLDDLEYDLSFSLFWGVGVLEMAELPEAGDGCEEA